MSGLIDSGTDLIVLILFALRKLGGGAATETILELCTAAPGTDSITYFDVSSALNSLIETEHLTLADGLYTITEKGARNGELTEGDIPYSVRFHTETAATERSRAAKRAELLRTSRTILRRGGYAVELSLSDGREEVMFLRVTAANGEQATAIENAFRDKAESIFGSIMGKLL
ncbi:MAG: DUF4364 family protein [Oscillospiraceae bacterium]|nr:DUF4364 family protein [Oscillospiraceae bacterium]